MRKVLIGLGVVAVGYVALSVAAYLRVARESATMADD